MDTLFNDYLEENEDCTTVESDTKTINVKELEHPNRRITFAELLGWNPFEQDDGNK